MLYMLESYSRRGHTFHAFTANLFFVFVDSKIKTLYIGLVLIHCTFRFGNTCT